MNKAAKPLFHKIYSSKILLYSVAVLLSVVALLTIYGGKILNPSYTGWLLNGGDISQHYLGWVAYRNSQWTFPIGLTDNLAYPNYTSVIYTDSIPCFAVFFKILSPLLPETFQYFGIWGMFCIVMQTLLSAKLLKNFTDSPFVIWCGSLLISLAPVMLFRIYEFSSLAAQWILLIGISILLTYRKKYIHSKKVYLYIAVMAICAASTHMYFVLMCGILSAGIALLDFFDSKKISRAIIIVLEYCIAALLTIALLGGFSSYGSQPSYLDCGYYSLNLNAIFNPQGYSMFLPDLPTYTENQYEGFAYIGLGGIILLLVSLPLMFFCRKELWKRYKNEMIVIGFVMVVTTIIALSPVASFGTTKLYELELPSLLMKAWGVFRASGRIIMVVSYLFMIIPIIVLCKRSHQPFTSLLMVAVVVLQFYDMSAILQSKHDYFANDIPHSSSFEESSIWTEIGDNQEINHIVVTYWAGDDFYKIGEWALFHGKTMNAFAMAHPDQEKIIEGAQKLLNSPNDSEIFIFEDMASIIFFGETVLPLHIYRADQYYLGYSGELPFESIVELTEEAVLSFDFQNNEYYMNGENSKDGQILYPGGLSYGPYCKVRQGEYLVAIYGVNLKDSMDILVYSDHGMTNHDYSVISSDQGKVELRLLLQEDVTDLEVAIKNVSDFNILLSRIEIAPYNGR